jgi:hypothetical protein
MAGYILVQIDMNYDARSHGFFAHAPEDWADMSAQDRQAFLDEAARNYLNEQIECTARYYATEDEACEVNADGWGPQFSPGDVEDIY